VRERRRDEVPLAAQRDAEPERLAVAAQLERALGVQEQAVAAAVGPARDDALRAGPGQRGEDPGRQSEAVQREPVGVLDLDVRAARIPLPPAVVLALERGGEPLLLEARSGGIRIAVDQADQRRAIALGDRRDLERERVPRACREPVGVAHDRHRIVAIFHTFGPPVV
jgi:hypothetical protein